MATGTIKNKKPAAKKGGLLSVVTAVLAVVSAVLTLAIFAYLLPSLGGGRQAAAIRMSVPELPARLDQKLAAMGPLLELDDPNFPEQRPVYRLDDADLIAPVPDPEGYGTSQSPLELLKWFPKKAAPLLDGETLYFSEGQELLDGTEVHNYLDDSIAVITWKEKWNNTCLTFAEVKIADASQFRRFLAGGRFGAETQFTTTEMAQSVNAVLASSGDFYKFRYSGIIVYDREVRRVNSNKADTCYINEDGDLIFTYQNEVMTTEQAQKFVDDNRIRFSLAFGPVLVDNGERCEPQMYDLGEINSYSSRAALCQLGPLHYLLVTANTDVDRDCSSPLTLHQFAERIVQTGCSKAYTLDGGQTAALALDGELENNVLFGQQRRISDIIYFATAVGG